MTASQAAEMRFVDQRAARHPGIDGFSLVELVVTLGIIGVLATVAIATYFGFRERAMTAEARLGLHSIWLLEKTHHKENGRYSADLNELSFQMEGRTRYTYTLQATADSFTARAVANLDGDATLDSWEVYTRTPDPVHLTVD